MAHTGFPYGVGTVSSPGPYPEKAPPLFSFLLEFKVHYFSKPYFDHVLHPSKYIYKREEERALYGTLARNERHAMCDLLVSFQV